MRRSELLLAAMDGVKDDYLTEAIAYRKEKMPRRRGIIIAAALAAALAVTAGAVGYSMRQAAREDLGITSPEEIPEYTEYAPEDTVSVHTPVLDHYAPGGQAELVSTLCSGNELTAYVLVPLDEAHHDTESPRPWDLGLADAYQPDLSVPCGACSFVVQETGFDPEAETALLQLRLMGVPKNADRVVAQVILRSTEHGDRIYDALEIPVTESTGLFAEIGKTVQFPDLEEFTAEIERVEVAAGYVSVEMKLPTYEEMMALLGDDAWEKLEAATGEAIEDEAYADVVYRDFIDLAMNPYERVTDAPDSPSSPHYILEGAALNFKDGTELVLAEQDSPFAGVWVHLDAYWREPMRTGDWTFRRVLNKPVNLDEVESITICDETYLLSP